MSSQIVEEVSGPNMRGGIPGATSTVRAHAGTVEAEEHATEVAAEHPGRVTGVESGEKPAPGSTPWQSRYFVNARMSADGNGYRIGETIPEAEARRQGLLQEPARSVLTPKQQAGRRICTRCAGRGTYGKKPKGHKEGCACRFCGPCPRCEGTRYEKEAA